MSRLKEVADISQTQILDFEQRRDNTVIELEALRHQVGGSSGVGEWEE